MVRTRDLAFLEVGPEVVQRDGGMKRADKK